MRAAAAADPRGFLDLHPAPVLFDEVQYAPDLLPYVKERIDLRRQACGQYLLTGSQHLLLLEKVTESLAGRAAVLRLLPLSGREACGHRDAPLPWETGSSRAHWRVPTRGLWEALLRGGYPELAGPRRNVSLWHASYVQTYLERDVRSLRQVGDLMAFQVFLRALAARNGQLLNLSDLARDLGLAVNTAKAWLSVLEASFQVIRLRPYFANVGKRLVKTPKVYFTDTGTLCYLAGLKTPEHAAPVRWGGRSSRRQCSARSSRLFSTAARSPRCTPALPSLGTANAPGKQGPPPQLRVVSNNPSQLLYYNSHCVFTNTRVALRAGGERCRTTGKVTSSGTVATTR